MNLPFCERLRLHFPSKSVIHFAANVISTDVSIRTEMRRSDTKILLTTNHMIDVIDLQGERNLRILRSLKLSTDSRLWSPALRRDDRCKRPRRLCMQMLTAEFVLSRIMHRTATGGSRRLAELPTDKTDRWKCMANNPVMRNASRNVARLLTRCPYKSLEWSHFGSYIIVSYSPSEISAVGFRTLAYGCCPSIPEECYLQRIGCCSLMHIDKVRLIVRDLFCCAKKLAAFKFMHRFRMKLSYTNCYLFCSAIVNPVSYWKFHFCLAFLFNWNVL